MGASSSDENSRQLTSVEVCAGAGGQAIGLHRAGFRHLALVEYDAHAHRTLEANVARAGWGECEILHQDFHDFDPWQKMRGLGGEPLKSGDLDLLAGGVPCPPFSVAGNQLGADDERDLFPRMLDVIEELNPRAVMIENVRGLMSEKFFGYRQGITKKLDRFGYHVCGWRLLEAHEFGVPQLRPRSVLVAIRKDVWRKSGLKPGGFPWPKRIEGGRTSAFKALEKSMKQRSADLTKLFPEFSQEIEAAHSSWWKQAHVRKEVAPTLVGGSRKHGGADLGPSRAKRAWAALGVNAYGVADEAVHGTQAEEKGALKRGFLRPEGPMLTVSQAAIIQGFPADWEFDGGKTAQYRQVGNAFPPDVAHAVGRAIASVLSPAETKKLLEGLVCEKSGVQLPEARSQMSIDDIPAPSPAASGSAAPDLSRDLVGAKA